MIEKTTLRSDQVRRYVNTTAYWNAHATVIPKEGDIYIYSDGASYEKDGDTVTVPRMKVGDGVRLLSRLPFVDDFQKGTLTIKRNNKILGSFPADSPKDTEINISVPVVVTTGSDDAAGIVFDMSPGRMQSEILSGACVMMKYREQIYYVGYCDGKKIPTIYGFSYDGNHTLQRLYIQKYAMEKTVWKLEETSIPAVNDAILTVQKNGTTIDTFSANASEDKTINITVPITAADVSALPSSTKYGASLSLSVNSSTYVVTVQLKDQDGNNLGSAGTIDLPLESVVVSGSYDIATKKVILTLQNGSTIEFSVADLVAGLQSEITAEHPLSADLVTDGITNKVFTITMRNKLDGIEKGAQVNVQSDWNQTTTTADDYIKNKPNLAAVATSGSYNDLGNKPTIPSNTSDLINDSRFVTESDSPYLIYIDPNTKPIRCSANTAQLHQNLIKAGRKPLFYMKGAIDTDIAYSPLYVYLYEVATLKEDSKGKVILLHFYENDVTVWILRWNTQAGTVEVEGGGSATSLQSDWNESDITSFTYIKNKPSIPTVPTNVSDLNNDAGYITASDVPVEVIWFTFSLSSNTYVSSITPAQILAYLQAGKCVLGLHPNDKDTDTKDVYHCMKYIYNEKSGDYVLSFANAKTNHLIYFVYDSTVGYWKLYGYPLQDLLIGSGTGQNLKTINNNDLLGSGNITIHEGDDNVQSDWEQSDPTEDDFIKNKPTITDEKVKQTVDATTTEYPLLMSAQSSPTSGEACEAKYSASLKGNGEGDVVFDKDSTKCRLRYNSTDLCLNFVF